MIRHTLLSMSLIALIPIGTNGKFNVLRNPLSPLTSLRKPIDQAVVSAEGAAEGWVEMDTKIDLRAVFQRLDDLPRILQGLTNLTSQVETYDTESLLSKITPEIRGIKASFGSGIGNIELTIKDLFRKLESGPLSTSEKKLLKILKFLEGQEGKKTQCELSELERGLLRIGETVESQVKDIQRNIRAENVKGDQELNTVRQNSRLLTEVLELVKVIEGHSQAFAGGSSCEVCKNLDMIGQSEKEVLNSIKLMFKTINGLPQSIATTITTEGGLGGIRKELRALAKANENIETDIKKLVQAMGVLRNESEEYFRKHDKLTANAVIEFSSTSSAIRESSQQTIEAVNRFSQEAARAARSARNCD